MIIALCFCADAQLTQTFCMYAFAEGSYNIKLFDLFLAL